MYVKSYITKYCSNLKVLPFLDNNKPYWAVIRDPYQRFISGLTYDILILNHDKELKLLDKFLNEDYLEKLFLKNYDSFFSITGNVPHTLCQWTYLYNQPVDFFVRIEDLTSFIHLHFGNDSFSKHPGNNLLQNKVKEYIDKNNNLKQLINYYLTPDLYLYKQLYNQGKVWEHNYGQMFYLAKP
jgi:hypothetical protein